MTHQVGSILRPYHRMPVDFGPASGPRNVPEDMDPIVGPERRSSVAFTVPVRSADVDPVLPHGLALRSAHMTVRVQRLSNLRWLAGRGYDIVSVSFPVRCDDGPKNADLLAVLWESMAEPIITGREELGFPKLYAEISSSGVDPAAGDFTAQASWDGVPFFTAAAHRLTAVVPAPAAPPPPTVTHRYLPAAGRLDTAELDYLTVTVPPPAGTPRNAIVHAATGEGELAFHEVSWRDNPVQRPIINALAAIEQTGPAAVHVSCDEGVVTMVGNRPLGQPA